MPASVKPALLLKSDPPPRAIEPYATPSEHACDHLRWLALLIGVRLHTRGRAPIQHAGPLDAFRGLVVSDAEVATLLRAIALPAGPETSPEEADAWRVALEQCDAEIRAREEISAQRTLWLPLAHLARVFDLSAFERRCLVLALAAEIDIRFERLFGYVQDDVTRRRPTIGLALELFCEGEADAVAARPAFDARAPLFRFRLCRLGDAPPDGSSLARSIGADARVVNLAMGHPHLDAETAAALRTRLPEHDPNPVVVDAELCERIAALAARRLDDPSLPPLIVHLVSPPDAGAEALAEGVCRRLQRPLIVTSADRLTAGPAAFDDLALRLGRESVLLRGLPFVDGFDRLTADTPGTPARLETLLDAMTASSRVIFAAGREPWLPPHRQDGPDVIGVSIPRPDTHASRRLWQAYLDREGDVARAIDVDSVASRFRLGTAAIHDTLAAARQMATWRDPAEPRLTIRDIAAACQARTTARLSGMVRRVESNESWDDLVLPEAPLACLRDIATHARHHHRVFTEWGFGARRSHGQGLSALFAGPPGTGKTMAARIIAADLQLDLLQIDLSQVVSKYIGETEKNLRAVFEEAEASHAILLFDEADALFGKRSEVKDARDRYANIEVSYLLQRMEDYEGIAILATNLRQNLDDAFIRRLRFVVEFPFPDEAQRRQIWRVTLPAEAPVGTDVDHAVLAREMKLAGGNIRNIALAAAFAAAADGGTIGMAHLFAAAGREHEKIGRTWTAPTREPMDVSR